MRKKRKDKNMLKKGNKNEDKEIKVIKSRVLDLSDLCMFQATLSGRFVERADEIVFLSWERRKRVYSLCLLSTGPMQVLIFINGNKMVLQ